MNTLNVALVQTCASRDLDRNIKDAAKLIEAAAKNGAQYIQTPEQTGIIDLDRKRVLALSLKEKDTKALGVFSDLAKKYGLFLHIGSLGIRTDQNHAANRSFVFGPNGDIIARYDKIHMFDVALSDGESYKESATYTAGNEIVTLPIQNDNFQAHLGLAICFDLRFPHLFRHHAHKGANILTCPSAFTETTGKAHWHVLLQARAIENGAFMLASGQAGNHECGRQSYGHSLIISPWGEILAEGDKSPGFVDATLNLDDAGAVLQTIPVLKNDVLFIKD